MLKHRELDIRIEPHRSHPYLTTGRQQQAFVTTVRWVCLGALIMRAKSTVKSQHRREFFQGTDDAEIVESAEGSIHFLTGNIVAGAQERILILPLRIIPERPAAKGKINVADVGRKISQLIRSHQKISAAGSD